MESHPYPICQRPVVSGYVFDPTFWSKIIPNWLEPTMKVPPLIIVFLFAIGIGVIFARCHACSPLSVYN